MMDLTTTSSLSNTGDKDESYVSCIWVDGHPILPPLMTDAKRAEMRHFRQLAIEREQTRRFQFVKGSQQQSRVGTAISSSSSISPLSNRKVYLTSTPNINNKNDTTTILPSVEVQNLQEIDDEDESDENFASATSSTDTYIINKNKSSQSLEDEKEDKSDDEIIEHLLLEDSIDKDDSQSAEPQTILRRPLLISNSKRKRPARYFNEDDVVNANVDSEQPKIIPTTPLLYTSSEDDNTITFPTTTEGTSSTSLSKYMTSCNTPMLKTTPTPHNIIPPLPNAVMFSPEKSDSTSTIKISPSFTINTNFAEAALATSSPRITKKGVRRSFTPKSRKSLSFTSTSTPDRSSTMKVTDPDFDFVLTTEIPESACSKSPVDEDKDNNSCLSDDSSDKENHQGLSGGAEHPIKIHARKLSYTLLTPSAELLAASILDPLTALPVINSAPSSSGGFLSSTQSTPMKPNQQHVEYPVENTASKLQQLHLGKGKKAHLERYLGELESEQEKPTTTMSTVSFQSQDAILQPQVQEVISRIELNHQKQLEALMETYRLQAEKIREEFDKERNKVIMELSSISPTRSLKSPRTASNKNNKDASSTTQSSSTILMDTSNLRNYYLQNESPTKENRGSSNSHIHTVHSVPSSPIVSQEKMPNVGLSQFQNKMQKINPGLLKHTVDIRSPLLKGLVFPDPLERSSAVPKIPLQALDASMKPKFDKLTAVVKGYLTRRLLNTEKIQNIIETIRDTVELLLRLYEENPANAQGLTEIKQEDQNLHHRLVQQLTGACSSFNDIFFKISIKERMAIIANDREKIRAKALKNVLNRRSGASPSKRNISSATLKSLERRQTESRSPPKKKDNQSNGRFRRSTLKPASVGLSPPSGSQSVKPKGVKSYNVSPKRRRMSCLGEAIDKQTKMTRISSAKNGNVYENVGSRRPYTSLSSRNVQKSSLTKKATSSKSSTPQHWSSDTFLVPSDPWPYHRSTASAKPPTNRPPTSRRSVLPTNSNSNTLTTRMSNNSVSTRVPWK